jgi:hypothetical protein
VEYLYRISPLITRKIFGYPKDECAKVVISTVTTFCEQNPNQPPKDIRLTNFDDPTGNYVYFTQSDDST